MNIILLKIANDEVPLATERDNRIYVSGPMTGLPNYNFDAFNEASKKLRELGWVVSNPADHGLVDGATREDYLRYDAAQLVSCSTVFLLPDWDKSDGARWEVSIATKLGMNLISEYIAPIQPAPRHLSPAQLEIGNHIANFTRKWIIDNNLYDATMREAIPVDSDPKNIGQKNEH